MNPVKKAIFLVAELANWLLSATKPRSKKFLALVDKPLIQYAVEEAVVSGIRV